MSSQAAAGPDEHTVRPLLCTTATKHAILAAQHMPHSEARSSTVTGRLLYRWHFFATAALFALKRITAHGFDEAVTATSQEANTAAP